MRTRFVANYWALLSLAASANPFSLAVRADSESRPAGIRNGYAKRQRGGVQMPVAGRTVLLSIAPKSCGLLSVLRKVVLKSI